MNLHLLARTSAILLLLTGASLPAQGAWSRQNDQPGFGIGGRVFHLGTFRNELIAGTYRTPWRDGSTLNHIARFDGVRWYPLGSGVSGPVRASLEFQGSLFVGGAFTTAGGLAAGNVARWNGTGWQPAGAGLDGAVWSFAEHQGQLYAAGDFTHSGTAAMTGIARWDGANWQPVGGGLQWNLGGTAIGYGLCSDGQRLYVGGSFDRAGTVAASHVASWDGTTWRALGGGINNFGWGWVRTLCMHNGRLYAGGAFGQAGAVLTDNVAAWDGTSWYAVGAGAQGSSYGADVWDLAVYNGELYVAGSFVVTGTVAVERIARFDGTALQPIGGVDLAEYNPPTIMALAVWNGRLYCGGEFHIAARQWLPDQMLGVYHLAAWDGAGWSTAGDGLGFGNEVHVLGRYQGQVIAGGRFYTAGGRFASGLARFDGNEWRHMAGFDGLITGMTVHNGDLWVAGEFYRVNNLVADGVARFDGTNWYAVGGGPGPHRAYGIASYQGMVYIGSTGSPLRWNGSAWQTFSPPITGMLTVMHVHNNVLYMGGSTPFHPGTPNLFAWDGANLTVPGGGLDGAVESLGSFNGNLVAGGRFTHAGSTAAQCIASFNGTGWSTFGTGIRGATVMAITTFGGQLTVGGDFSRYQGENADYVARWNGSGWQPIGPSAPQGAVFALLADDARGELHVGGWYSQNGSQDDSFYSLWQNTPAWTEVGQGLGNPRRTPYLRGDGSLLPGARTRWSLSSAQESSPAAFVLGFTRADQPLLGAVLVPNPEAVLIVGTDPIGTATLQVPWPPLAGLQVFAQGLVLDATGPQGITASNAVWLRAP
jgi:hypothetical protein